MFNSYVKFPEGIWSITHRTTSFGIFGTQTMAIPSMTFQKSSDWAASGRAYIADVAQKLISKAFSFGSAPGRRWVTRELGFLWEVFLGDNKNYTGNHRFGICLLALL